MPRFHGIQIEATGQNIITLGDGNQIDATYRELGAALAELRMAIAESGIPESQKLSVVADIETIQAQLAKPEPSKGILSAAWTAIKGAATVEECTHLIERVGRLMTSYL